MQSTAPRLRAGTSSLLNWYLEGARAALFLRPRWQRVQPGPAAVALLTLGAILLTVLLERLYMGDTGAAARFNWRAIGNGWLGTVLTIWACYLVRPTNQYDPNPQVAPGPAHLICAVLALAQVVTLASGVLYLVLLRAGWYSRESLGAYGVWAVWLLPSAWGVATELALVLRAGARRRGPRLLAVPVLLAAALLYFWLPPARFWSVPDADYAESSRPELDLTQDLMEAQPPLLARRLDALAAQRPGVVDLYAVTFAPYADEDVFRNESAMVSEVMAQRFDAQGRTLQLVNHVDTADTWPWATPLNLRRAIRAVAARMDRNEDVLFLHLTSHGARDGELAADFWPMTVDSVTPEDLKAWLDEAGIRYRVLSISACYSGSWVAPLADANTLIMTAADADHTSYGCGRGSELTYFGRAVYNEQLREHTLSFEQAHATARVLIKQREEAAGKSDGYSNPQIDVGAGVRPRLERLAQRLGN
jgi:hypothetical protein